jgi:RNA polymerase nonessential primary-like sigma factor
MGRVRVQRDALKVYMAEVRRIPLLKPEQEILYGHQIQAMMSILQQKEELEEKLQRHLSITDFAAHLDLSSLKLEEIINTGQKARALMIKSNLRLVSTIAYRYRDRGLEDLDLIQEGTLGLASAAEKFDPSEGCKFSTCAYWWVRQAITRAIANQGRTIRLPIHVTEKLNKIKKAQHKISQEKGRTATSKEISQETGYSMEKVRELLLYNKSILSLNRISTNDEDTLNELGELIEDKSSDLYKKLEEEEALEIADFFLNSLNQKEKEVILLRKGFKGEEQSLRKIKSQSKIKVSAERIRQIEKKSMKKMKLKSLKYSDYKEVLL